MSNPIEILLTRNLYDLFGERDADTRRAVMAEILTEDCLFTDPKGVKQGFDAIDKVIDSILSQAPDFVFSHTAPPQTLTNSGRIAWGFGPAGEPPRLTGQDFILTRDGKIAALYTFLDTPPAS
ncbi:nuclear transport factor 2 family protein [bacterium]|nr:MAG: nuclear transport factor 2 family protein [bacterium]